MLIYVAYHADYLLAPRHPNNANIPGELRFLARSGVGLKSLPRFFFFLHRVDPRFFISMLITHPCHPHYMYFVQSADLRSRKITSECPISNLPSII